MPQLYPTVEIPQQIFNEATTESTRTGYKPSVYFDPETGDFVRGGSNKLQSATGIEAWQAWCWKVIQTTRYAHYAYSKNYGVEIEEAFHAPDRATVESILERTMTEAIMADPYQRTNRVEEITFDWTAPDTVDVHLTIVGMDEATIDVEVTLKGR